MAYELVRTVRGQYAVDWETIYGIIRNYCRAGAQLDCARTVRESQAGINPLSWGLPDLEYVEVDWDKVREQTQKGMIVRSIQAANDFARSPEMVANQMKTLVSETKRYQDRFQNYMKSVSQSSTAEIEKSVKMFGNMVEGAKWVRDLSGAILVGLGTGGAGTAATVLGTGAGTFIKTVGKYEDTGSVGLATVEAATGLVFTFIPAVGGFKLTGTEKMVKAVISTGADTYKGVLEGKSVWNALAAGSLQLAAPQVGELVKSQAVQNILGKVAVPVLTNVVSGPLPVNELTKGLTSKLSEELFKKAGKAGVDRVFKTPKPPAPPSGGTGELADYLTFADEALVRLAIVDMSAGVGRSGW